MKHNILGKMLVVAIIATQGLQGLSSASYLSSLIYEVKELAYSHNLDQDKADDVDVYDDTPSTRDYGQNGFLFRRSSSIANTTSIVNKEEEKIKKERASLPQRPFPKIPIRASRPGDVDVYDDTYVRNPQKIQWWKKRIDTTTTLAEYIGSITSEDIKIQQLAIGGRQWTKLENQEAAVYLAIIGENLYTIYQAK